ncbi:unnamed protein product [Adineta ricciae]|uniref:Peptidase S9 prolyl oligopeptidase catalytic domain-containing protein n=1 Tax=Adineta ricciae TaxID=249248 RepID=A0A814CP78_ADIRI|nr:unnamed protein product [Adineta ricciae]CAF0951824.1 unnamed protein product [Adineta ricciae]
MIFVVLVLQLLLCSFAETKPKLTQDEFFNYVDYPTVSVSPTGEYLFYEEMRPSWETNSFVRKLWLYDIRQQQKRLITADSTDFFFPMWSPSGKWITFFVNNHLMANTSRRSLERSETADQYMYFYSVSTNKIIPVQIQNIQPSVATWSNSDTVLYIVGPGLSSREEDDAYRKEWKDVINYRQTKPGEGSTIYEIKIDTTDSLISAELSIVYNASLLINELLYVSYEEQLVFTSKSRVYEDLDNFEIYSIHLNQPSSSFLRLTSLEGIEQNLQLSNDGKHILFRLWALSSGRIQTTQRRLYSLDLITLQIGRLGANFNGVITEFTIKPDGGVYFIGQLGLNVQVYTQESLTDDVMYRQGWNGTYERFSSPSNRTGGPIAFAFSSLERPKEIYLAESIDRLGFAKTITDENRLFTQRDLPHATAYHWRNTEDNREIEGILHYPPGKLTEKNLPLLVLIHGGPNAASVNELQATWNWATMAATEGWLVLEPNYRGSTGYGDEFLDELRHRLLSLPGQDILMGVDQLIKDGIADSQRLAVGGYSYGGFLTNWLITQTTRFNAALSGAGGAEHASGWGTMDLPVLLSYLHGGFPWQVPNVYSSESPIYHMSKVRTPTHIVVGENDVRVDADQSFILERCLHYLGVPVQLLILPKEGHAIANYPWSGRIKVREELKWLHQYGNQTLPKESAANIISFSFTLLSLVICTFCFSFQN